MEMELRIMTAEEKIRYRDDILEMMKESDNDFVPPLSKRFSTSQTDFVDGLNQENGLVSYMDDMLQFTVLGAFEGEKLMAFLGYKENLVQGPLTEDTLPNIYLCTLVLRSEARGKRLTQKIYAHVFDDLYPERNIFTRTWSTNAPHLHILDRFGFAHMLRKVDDRGPGVDTIYFSLMRK